tara:strand:- start:1239 stop:1439 length:201 start_codon:yes stop_codon:yes gene_type:complete
MMVKRKGYLVSQIAPETGMRVEYTYKSRAKKKAKSLRKKGKIAYVRKGPLKMLPDINWGVWTRREK